MFRDRRGPLAAPSSHTTGHTGPYYGNKNLGTFYSLEMLDSAVNTAAFGDDQTVHTQYSASGCARIFLYKHPADDHDELEECKDRGAQREGPPSEPNSRR